MRHVIIEGPDGAGKTRLARWVCHKYVMAYHHEGPPPDGVLHHYAGLLANASRPTVFDRLHLGELVYGPLLRGESALTPDDMTLMTRLIRGTGSSVVICLPPWETCLANTRHRHELITDAKVLRAAYDAWRVVNARADLGPKQYYDYTTSVGFTLQERPRCPDGVVGSPTARALFIGEQANSGVLDLAFFGTERSSGFLNERIVEAGFVEPDIAFTNALDMKGNARDLAFLISQMPHLEVVITLGRTASNQLSRQGVPPFVRVHDLPHPQFWKRFHAHETTEYTRMIARSFDVA